MPKLQYTCIPKINKTVNKSYISAMSISADLSIKSNKQTLTNIASSFQTEEPNSASGSIKDVKLVLCYLLPHRYYSVLRTLVSAQVLVNYCITLILHTSVCRFSLKYAALQTTNALDLFEVACWFLPFWISACPFFSHSMHESDCWYWNGSLLIDIAAYLLNAF